MSTPAAQQAPTKETAVHDPAATTMPKLLFARAADDPDGVAMQEKRYGIWQPMSWSLYAERVKDFAHGLTALGAKRGDVITVIGDNRPEWLIAELAAQAIGASVVGVYPTSLGEELAHIITSADSHIVVAEDQEQVDKMLALREALGERFPVEHVIFYVPQGLEKYTDDLLMNFVDAENLGREWGAANPGWFDEQLAAGRPDDTAVICATSGTTSLPKLALLSHHNLLSMAHSLAKNDPVNAKTRYVSMLPFSWIGEQMLAVSGGLVHGITVFFPEDGSTQKIDMREIGPHVMFAPPRIWESMLSEVQVRIEEAGRIKRAIFGWGYDISDKRALKEVNGEKVSPWLKVLDFVADMVAARPIRE